MRSRFRLLRRLSVANFRLHKWRWILTVIGVAVGVASLTGILAITRSIIHAFEQSVVRTAGQAQLQVSNGSSGVAADLVREISAVPGVAVASGTVQYDVTLPALGRRLTIFGILFGEDHTYREAQFGHAALQMPDAATFLVKADSIALTTALQTELGLKLGSIIEVLGPKGARTLVVRGTVADGGALSIFGGDVAVMDSEAAQQAFGELDRFHWIDVVPVDGANLGTVRDAAEKAVAGRGVVETPFGRSGRMEAMLGTLRWIMTASGTVSMLVGIFLIQHTVSTAIARRRADFVKLRAIGATRWVVVAVVLTEALVMGALGSLLGILGGLAFARAAVGLFGDSISSMYASLPPPPVMLTPGEVIASFAVGEGTVLLAALVPGLQLLRLRPLAARTPIDAATEGSGSLPAAIAGVLAIVLGIIAAHSCGRFGFAGGVTMIAAFAGLVFLGTTLLVPMGLRLLTPVARMILQRFWGSLGRWMWSQLGRHRYHTATTIGAIAAAVAFTIGISTLLGSYRGSVGSWINQTMTADVFVIAGARFSLLTGPTIAPEMVTEVGTVPGVLRTLPWRFVQVQFRDRPIIVQSAPAELIRRWHPDVDPLPSDGSVLISESLAERFKLDVGDRLDVPAPVAPVSVRVGAVVADYLLDLGNFTLPRDAFVQHFGDDQANILFVDLAENSSTTEVKRHIEEKLAGRYDVTVLTGKELRDMVNSMIDQSFALTGALQFFAVLVTILAMINATTAAILDRTLDLATWRALGLERARLVRVLVVEACVLGLVGGVLGLAAGTLIGGTLVDVVAPVVTGFRLVRSWPVGWAVIVVTMTMLFAGGTASLVARARTPRPIVLRNLRS